MYEVNLLPEEHFILLAKLATGSAGFGERPDDVCRGGLAVEKQ